MIDINNVIKTLLNALILKPKVANQALYALSLLPFKFHQSVCNNQASINCFNNIVYNQYNDIILKISNIFEIENAFDEEIPLI